MANKIYIELEVDDKGTAVVRGFDKQTERAFNKMRKNADKASKGIGGSLQRLKQHWLAVAAAMAGVIAGLGKAVKAASDLQEVTNKFEVVFADQIARAEEFAGVLVDSYAMSTREAKEYLSSIQDLLVPMGMQRDLAGQLSFEITKLAADLGSFNNMPTAQVMGDIQSALVGNYETMKKYGVVINATMVQERALAMGLARTKDELTTAQKAYAAYAMIVEDSEAAVGDMARTQDSYANTLKRFKAATEDLAASIGRSLIPALTETFGWLAKIVKKYNEWVGGPSRMDKLLAQYAELSKKRDMLRTRMKDESTYAQILKMHGVSVKEVTGQYEEQIAVLEERMQFIAKSINEENRLRAAAAGTGAAAPGAPPPPAPAPTMTPKDRAEVVEYTDQVTLALEGFKQESETAWRAYREGLGSTKPLHEEFTAGIYGERAAIIALEQEIDEGLQQSLDSLDKKGVSTFDDLKTAVTGWASTFSAQLNDMLWAAETTFKDILEAFGRMVTQMLIQKAVVEPLLASAFAGAGTASTGKTAAYGAVFDRGRVMPYGRGGIVDRPMIFPMAGGAGLMGEKGPEAVMPLTRTAGGDLGVKAHIAAPNIAINVINRSGTALEATQKDARQESGRWVIDVVMKELRTGRSLRNMIRSTT